MGAGLAQVPTLRENLDDDSHQQTGYESSDVRPPGHAAMAARTHEGSGTAEQLKQKPKPQNEQCREFGEPDKEAKRNQGEDTSFGKHDQVGSQDTGDGAAGTDRRNGGCGVRVPVGQGCHPAAPKIEEDELPVAKPVLDVVAKDPQVQHVPKNVTPASVQEHGKQDGLSILQGPTRFKIYRRYER